MFKHIKSVWTRHLSDETGTATVESVLWLPVFFLFLITVADLSFIFLGQNQAHRIIQDANRQLSIGWLRDPEDVEEFIGLALAPISPNATYEVVIEDSVLITSWISMPASDLVSIGLLTALVDADVSVKASHYVEY